MALTPTSPTVGARLSNLRRVLAGGGSSGLGTLGFLATTADSRDLSSFVLVSNRHVLLAHDAAAGDVVYQPEIEPSYGGVCFVRERLNPVATIEDEGLEGHHRYAYPGEPEDDYFLDAATARVTTEPPSGANGHGGRGEADRPLFRNTARVHRFDTFAGRELRVRKLGRDRRLTGRVVDVAATVAGEDGRPRRNTMVIRTLSGAAMPFAGEGDSGALVVDEHDRAVGLLWGVGRDDPAIAYACHIHPLLDRLRLTPWRRGRPPAPPREEETRR